MSRFFFSTCLLVAPLLVGVFGSQAVAVGADGIASERRLPPDVVAYGTIRSVNELKAEWFKTYFSKLFSEKELSDFWQELKTQWSTISDKVRDQTGLTLDEILTIPKGEISGAVMQTGGKPVAFVVLIDIGDRRADVQKLLDKAAKTLTDEGAKRAETEFEDTNIISFSQMKEAEDDDGNKGTPHEETLGYFLKDNYLVAGSSVESMKAVVSRWDGKSEKTLADKEVFKYIKERCRNKADDAAPPIMWFIDPINFLDVALSTGDNPQAQTILGILPALGVDKLKGIGGTFNLAEGDYDTVGRTLIYIEPPPEKILKILDFPAIAQSPPKWVPAKVSTYFGLNWNVEGAYAAVANVWDSFQGDGALERMVEELASSENGPGINIKKDVVDQLTGSVQIYGKTIEGKEDEGESYIFGLGVKDEAAFKKSLASVANIPGFPGKTREFRGGNIYEISLGGGGDDDDGDGGTGSAGLAVTHKYFMIATDVTLLEEVMRADADQDSLVDSKEYRAVSKFFPPQSSSVGFSRADLQIKTLYETLRTGKADDLFGSDIKIDFSKLPPFQTIQSYLTPTGSFIQPDDRGFFWLNFSLREPVK